jgi:S-adenosylmethionine:tRNA ribosyltransferase-isomerase
MRISDYSYTLPEELIASHPPKERGTSRLLVLGREKSDISHRRYSDLAELLEPGDVVVLNDTKVIKARLIAKNSKHQDRELLLLEEHAGSDPHTRRAMYRGKLTAGETLHVGDAQIVISDVLAGGIALITSKVNLLSLASHSGSVPLPPYMNRAATAEDTKRYQTVFAKKPGSVAAPTASLNFTKELGSKLVAKGVKIAYLTLHVGLGTFLPIRTGKVEDHVMHSEYFEIPTNTAEVIRHAKAEGRKILALGTTVARTLEFAAPQLLNKIDDRQNYLTGLQGEANIFIYPGYEFKMVDALLTNFHAPKSTVLMLTAAFAGWENLTAAYQAAINEKYAFLSYGDSMLIK